MDIFKAREELQKGKSIYDMNLRVVDYSRVSTLKDEQLNSLDNQNDFFGDMIDGIKNWIHVDSYCDEGISGTQVAKREDFLRMIEDARLNRFDLIVTKEVSRFARNTLDSIKFTRQLMSYGVIVLFVSDGISTLDPDSELRLTIMSSLAQDESRKISMRVKFGIRRSIKDRKVGGGGIYGYLKKDGILSIYEPEAEVVRKIYNLYNSETIGLRKIGELLAEEGYFTRKGRVFSDTTLKKMIKNKRYKGFFTGNLSTVTDYLTHSRTYLNESDWVIEKHENVPAIVSEEVWEHANNILKARSLRCKKNVLNQESYLENKTYTSKFICLDHNTTFIRQANGQRKKNPVWVCNEYIRHGLKGCSTPILYEEHLDTIFTDIISRFMKDKKKLLSSIVQEYVRLIEHTISSNDIEKLQLKLNEQNLYKERLFEMSLKKMISDSDFIDKNRELSEKIKNIKKELLVLQSRQRSGSYYEQIASTIEKTLEKCTDIKNNIGKYFNLFIDKVFVSKINNDRKHIKLDIVFNFNNPNEEIELNYHDYHSSTNNREFNASSTINHLANRDYINRVSFDTNILRQKYLLLEFKQPWVRCNGTETRDRNTYEVYSKFWFWV